jgi:hypothetical protein
MKTIGYRKGRPITSSASAELLVEGARFNDEIHRLPSGHTTFIPKGLFRFKSHEDANRRQQDCLSKAWHKPPWSESDGGILVQPPWKTSKR